MARKGRKRVKRLTSNLGLKILSIFLAILLWFYVQGREISEMAVKYGIIYSSLAENLYIEDTSANEVLVWLKGPKNILKRFSKNDGKIEINLKNFSEGKHTIEIKEDMLKLTSGIDIIRIQPNKLIVTIQKFIEKQVKVVPQYRGKKKFFMEPNYIKIKGERKSLAEINEVYTEVFKEGNKKHFYVNLISPSDNIKLETDKVRVIFY